MFCIFTIGASDGAPAATVTSSASSVVHGAQHVGYELPKYFKSSTAPSNVLDQKLKERPILDSPFFFSVDDKKVIFRAGSEYFHGCMTVETYSRKDLAAFSSLMLDPDIASMFHDKVVDSPAEVMDLADLLREMDRRVEEGDYRAPLTVRDTKGKIVGFIWMEQPYTNTQSTGAVYLCIDKEYRDKGYGKLMSASLFALYTVEMRRIGQRSDHSFQHYFNAFNGGILERVYASVRINNTPALLAADALMRPYTDQFRNNSGILVQAQMTVCPDGKERAVLKKEDCGKNGEDRCCYVVNVPHVERPPLPLAESFFAQFAQKKSEDEALQKMAAAMKRVSSTQRDALAAFLAAFVSTTR